MNASTAVSVPAGVKCPAKPVGADPLLPFRPISLRAALACAVAGAALVIPSLEFLAWVPGPPPTDARTPVIGGAAIAAALLLHVLIGPFLEEVVFRGFILRIGRRYLPAWLAVAGSAFLFAVPHLAKNLGVTLLAFPMGCLFAWMSLRSGSLWSSLACHLSINLAAGVGFISSQALTPGRMPTFASLAELFPGWVSLLGLALAGWALRIAAQEFARRNAAT